MGGIKYVSGVWTNRVYAHVWVGMSSYLRSDRMIAHCLLDIDEEASVADP